MTTTNSTAPTAAQLRARAVKLEDQARILGRQLWDQAQELRKEARTLDLAGPGSAVSLELWPPRYGDVIFLEQAGHMRLVYVDEATSPQPEFVTRCPGEQWLVTDIHGEDWIVRRDRDSDHQLRATIGDDGTRRAWRVAYGES